MISVGLREIKDWKTWSARMYCSNYVMFLMFLLYAIEYSTNMRLLYRAACFPVLFLYEGVYEWPQFWYNYNRTKFYIYGRVGNS